MTQDTPLDLSGMVQQSRTVLKFILPLDRGVCVTASSAAWCVGNCTVVTLKFSVRPDVFDKVFSCALMYLPDVFDEVFGCVLMIPA